MSAPVPLNSGCCAPPCPDNPQTAVPGPAGENAFSFTVGNFTQPNVGANVVVTLTHDGWVAQGQNVFVQGGGYYQVVSLSGLTVTLNNLGVNGNASPGATILTGAKVSPAAVSGVSGNAYTTTAANFTQPAVSAQVNVQVVNSSWASVGQYVFVSAGGTYQVFGIPDSTHLQLTNLGYSANAAPTTLITSPQTVSPAGPQGPTGSAAGITLNSLSPTTTKGDLIVDNGAHSPAASDVRLGVGSDGKAVVADSSQATGLNYATITPNSVATSGDIAIFNGTSGTPTPLQDSKLLITSDGAIQSTPSGGNARGSKAVDLQVTRSNVAQVASGTNSGVLCGENNTASATDSLVAGGKGNTSSNTAAAVAGGQNNQATGVSSFVGGGNSNTASGTQSTIGAGQGNLASANNSAVAAGTSNSATQSAAFVGGGFGNVASGIQSSVLGGDTNTAAGFNSTIVGGTGALTSLFAAVTHGNFNFATTGDCQTSEILYAQATTDATPTESFLDGLTVRAIIPLNTTWGFIIHTIARSSAGVCAMWETKGAIQNNGGTVTLVAAVSQSVIADGTGGTWGVTANHTVSADNTNKSLKVLVTGAVATNIRWVTHARLVEVNF